MNRAAGADNLSPQPNLLGPGVLLPFPNFWITVVLCGVGAGLGGAALMTLLRFVQHSVWSYHAGSFLHAVQAASSVHRVFALCAAGVVAAVGLPAIRRYTPDGPGLSSAIWFHAGRVPLVRTIANAIMSIILVGLGASLGREAAPKEVAAAMASFLSDRLGLTNAQRRLIVACAAGAGMAAVYNVPLGGAVFALEVLFGSFALPCVIPALVTSLLATAVAWTVLPMQATFSIPMHGLTPSEIVWAMILGPFAGIAGVAFVRVISWAGALKPRGVSSVVISLGVFAFLGAASIAFPQLLGNGKSIVDVAISDRLGPALIATLFVLKLAATAGCRSSGAPGGLFMPTLAFGASLGALIGYPWEHAWPTHQPGDYAIIGAGAVLAAATQGPVSAIVLILELTAHADGLMLPIMIAVAESVFFARYLESRSIYSARFGRNTRVRKPSAAIVTSFDDLVAHEYAAVTAATPLAMALLANRHGTLYVVDEHDRLVGSIESEFLDSAALPPRDLPLATMTAGDVASIVPIVITNMTRECVIARLNEAGRSDLPLIDIHTGTLVGMVALSPSRRASKFAFS